MNKLFKATVIQSGYREEVPVYAKDLDEALKIAEAEYGYVERVRPVIAQ